MTIEESFRKLDSYRGRWILIFIAGAVLSASCAAKRPVIFRDPSFSDYSLLKKRSAFLLWSPININSVVQDYISAFTGNYESGRAFTQSALVDYLTGREKSYIRTAPPIQLNLIGLHSESSSDSIHTCMAISQDAYGVATLTITRRESLAASLAAAQVDYLIVVYGMMVTRGATTSQPVLLPIKGAYDLPVLLGGGTTNIFQMSAQVFVIHGARMTVIWNGFVSGKHEIISKFTKNSAKGVAESFMVNLYDALNDR